jgi:DMSO reductase anchor subunit
MTGLALFGIYAAVTLVGLVGVGYATADKDRQLEDALTAFVIVWPLTVALGLCVAVVVAVCVPVVRGMDRLVYLGRRLRRD